MDILVKEGADVNCTDVLFDVDCRKKIGVKIGYTETCGDLFTLQDGGTPLIYAAAVGNIENIALLIQEGADVNLIRNKNTALGMAAQSGNPKVRQVYDRSRSQCECCRSSRETSSNACSPARQG